MYVLRVYPRAMVVQVADLPDTGVNINEYLGALERSFLEKALEKAGGVKTKAAELLGLSFREFRYRLSK